jgi:hypothetical protein
MKKLILLIAAGVSIIQASAQSINSVVFVGSNSPKRVAGVEMNMPPKIAARNASSASANKTTATMSSWFNYTDIMASSSTSKFYYNPMFHDSNVIFPFSNGAGGIWEHGFGTSFDPTDSVFFGGDANLKTSAGFIANTSYIPSFRVTQGNAYQIDSIAFPMKYYRGDANTAQIDTLIITLVKAKRSSNTTPGIFGFHYSTLTNVTPDGKAGFGTLLVDYKTAKASDSIPTSAKVVITKMLDATTAADTTTGTGSGYLNYTTRGIALSSPMSVAAGELVVAYVTVRFKAYALNTPVANANYVRFYTTDISGSGASPRQCVNSMMCGLVATDETTYQGAPGDTSGFQPQGHNVAIPSIAYNSDGQFSDFSMKVTCNGCPPLSIATINSNIQNVDAYPNPTNADITIKFNLKETANANVTITNAVGQIVATQNVGNVTTGNAVFSTEKMANGVYFYTVEANGQRSTQRFVVAH